jgi:hypothetical protein
MRKAIVLLLSALLLSSCTVTFDSPEVVVEFPADRAPEVPSPQEPTAAVTPYSREDLEALIRSTPSVADLDGLAEHINELEFAASFLAPIEISYTLGPTADPERVGRVIDSFANKLKIYQLLGLEALGMDWLIVSEQDFRWWVDFRIAQDPDYPVDVWNETRGELGHCRLSPEVFCGAGQTVSGNEYQDNVVGTKFDDQGIDYVARHEAAHFYQAVFGYGGRCWMAEGQATFFETYLESSSRSRSQVIASLLTSFGSVDWSDQATLTTLMRNNSICDDDYRVAYDLGMLAYEYLYLNFSFFQIHELQVVSSKQPWSEAVSAVLGIDSGLLDASLAGYIFEQLQET